MAILSPNDILRMGELGAMISREISVGDIIALGGVAGGLFWTFVNHVIKQRAFDAHVDDAESKFKDLNTKVHTLETEVKAPALQVQLLEREIARVDARIDQIKAESDRLNRRLEHVDDKIMDKLSKLERDIATVIGQVGVRVP